jgi:hypothetical protein
MRRQRRRLVYGNRRRRGGRYDRGSGAEKMYPGGPQANSYREFIDLYSHKSPQAKIYEDIYLTTKEPTRYDQVYETIRAAERIPKNRANQADAYNLYKLEQQLKMQQDQMQASYQEKKRQFLIEQSLLEKFSGQGILMGGKAVDFPEQDEEIDKETLEEYQKVSLSNEDIRTLLNGQVNILTYPELMKFNDIEDVLGPYNACVILYMNKKNYGHWCCLFKTKDGRISFFDPYGGNNLPDEELKQIPEHFREESGQTYPHLTWLLYKSGYPVEYNDHRYQKLQQDVNTCGRHCIVRLRNKDLNSDQYYQMMKHESQELGMDYDELVTAMTSS